MSGRTNLIQAFCKQPLDKQYDETDVGEGSGPFELKRGVNVQFFSSMWGGFTDNPEEWQQGWAKMHYQSADCFLLVYSVKERYTFEQWIPKHFEWIQQLQEGNTPKPCAVVATHREVSTEEGQALAHKLGLEYFEVSALNHSPEIDQAFMHVLSKTPHFPKDKPQCVIL